MAGIFSLGTSGIFAAQRQLQTVGHNISNSSNELYSRQVTELQTNPPTRLGGDLVGTGVRIGRTARVVDQILIDINRDNISEVEELDSFLELANRINIVLSDTENGVSDSINNFFDSIQTLTSDPSSVPARQVLADSSRTLAQRVNSLSAQINTQLADINGQIREIVTQINGFLESLVSLNQDISAAQNLSNNGEPSDLLDQRDLVLNRLARLVDVEKVEQPDGRVDVYIGNGQSVLVGNAAIDLVASQDETDPLVTAISIRTSPTTLSDISENITGGTLGGLLQVRGEVLESTLNSLGRVAITLASTINEQHRKGVDLRGNLGQNFFSDVNEISATLNRSIPDFANIGTANLAVTIDPISRPQSPPFTILGDASALVDINTLPIIDNQSDLTINGSIVQNAQALDDTLSTVDNERSAIAIAAAINSSGIAGITATPEINSLYLGTFTPGTYTAGQFTINGVNIPGGADEATLLQNINALTPSTGVSAVGDGALGITLVATDGRNIQVTSDTSTPTATFSLFDTNSAVALNQVQRAGIRLSSVEDAITIGGNNPSDAGLISGTTPTNSSSSLTISDYTLNIVGTNYQLFRDNDSTQVAAGTVTDFVNNGISVDGFTINISSGTLSDGDDFLIRPTRRGGNDFRYNLIGTETIAAGFPVVAESTVRSGTGIINVDSITNTTGLPLATANVLGNAFSTARTLNPPIRIEFFNDNLGQPTIYRVFDVSSGSPGTQLGPDRTFVVGQKNDIFPLTAVTDTTPPGPNAPYTYDPGYRVSITGTPAAGDQFQIGYNLEGVADGRNTFSISSIQTEKIIDNQSSSIQEAFSISVAAVGAITARTESSLDSATSLLQQSEDLLLSVSGVSLDEEAAKLLQFQQLYRAAAQLIVVGREIFDVLISTFR